MNSPFERPSAKIYEFPVRGRAGGSFVESASQVLAMPRKQPARVAYDECWYHQAAIDLDPPLKN